MEDDNGPRNRELREKHEIEVELDRFERGIARRRKRTWLDLAMIAAAMVVIAVVENRYDLFNLLTGWMRAHEPTPTDEILAFLIALSLFGGIFSYRRWLDLRSEIRARERTERALRLLRTELEARVEARTAELRDDISRRKQAENALRASESRTRALMDNAKDAIFVNLPNGAIIDCNLAAESLLGRPRSEILGLRVTDSVGPEERQRVGQAVAETLAGGGVDGFETLSLRADGSLVPVEVSASVVEVGTEMLVLAIVRDVSERKRLEEQYRDAQKTEAIARLAAGVAHDFNNLLMVVQGVADVLPLHARDETAMAKDLGNLRMISERGGALTRQLLAFSRQQVLQTEILDVGKLVNDLSPMIDGLIGEDIGLTIRAAPDSGAVCMDPSQMEQIVMNLVVNARDAMPSGGRLSIDVSAASVDAVRASGHDGLEPGKYVRISVTDDGVGMSAEVRKNIFQPFFSTKEQGKGTGLGLATVRGIVKNLKGLVRAHSEATGGSVFEVLLPMAAGPGRVRRSSSEAAVVSAPGVETILVVEDEETIREMTESFLSGIGYRVISAADGWKALERLADEKGRIHLVVTDVMLPGPGGQEVATAAVARDPNTRVIFMSGYTDDAEIQKSVAFEGFDFLQKPFPLNVLASRIRAALDRVA